MGFILPVFHNSINKNCSEKQNPRYRYHSEELALPTIDAE